MKLTSSRQAIAIIAGLFLSQLVLAHWGAPDPVRESSERMYPAARHGGNYMHNYYFPPALSSTPWAPSWSPDGRHIAVSMAGSIWQVDPDSGRAEELTYNSRYHSSPDWSPDGRWIIYTADDGGKSIKLEMLDVLSGESQVLTDDEYIYTDPVFSPDGKTVAYVSTKPSGYFNVYVRAIEDGQWAGPELAVTEDNRFPRDRLYFGEWDMHVTPEWTLDGNELLIVSNRDVALGAGPIWRVPVKRHAMNDARIILDEQSLYRARPDVSIDGKRIVYSSSGGAADQYANLYVLPVDGGQPYKMTFYEHDAFHPRWSPDGNWIAYISNDGGLPQLELLETYGGERRKVAITERRWKRPTGTLSVRIVDGSTGEPTPARMQIVAADGKAYCPPESFARFSQGGHDHVFHSGGTFDVEVPVGTLLMTASKGFEFWPREVEVDIAEGKRAEVDISLDRMADMAAKGWYSGSTHMHMNYGGNLYNTLENMMFMSAAEDQDVVNELIANKDNRVLDHQYFISGGGAHPLSTDEQLLMVGQEYRPPFYGHVTLIGLRDHLLSPWATGYEGTGIESLYPSNTDMLRKAKAQEATTGYAHAFFGEDDPLEGTLGIARGFMVDAAFDTTDGVEWSFSGRAAFYPWYAALNNGLRVTATGGDDAMSDLHVSKMAGSARTYVYTGEAGLDAEAWKRGIREGKAMVSTGPLVEMTANGQMPGGTVELPETGGDVEVAVVVRSITPLERVMLIRDGKVVEEIPLADDRRSVDYTTVQRVGQSGWFHVRAEGRREESFPLDTGYAQGFTNPVWVSVGGHPVRNEAAARYSMAWIDKMTEMAEVAPGWRSQAERDHVFGQFREARAIYERFAAEARASDARTRP